MLSGIFTRLRSFFKNSGFSKTIKSFKFLLKKMENIQYLNIDTDRTHFTWFRDRFILSKSAEIGWSLKWMVRDYERLLKLDDS